MVFPSARQAARLQSRSSCGLGIRRFPDCGEPDGQCPSHLLQHRFLGCHSSPGRGTTLDFLLPLPMFLCQCDSYFSARLQQPMLKKCEMHDGKTALAEDSRIFNTDLVLLPSASQRVIVDSREGFSGALSSDRGEVSLRLYASTRQEGLSGLDWNGESPRTILAYAVYGLSGVGI